MVAVTVPPALGVASVAESKVLTGQRMFDSAKLKMRAAPTNSSTISAGKIIVSASLIVYKICESKPYA